MLYSKVLNTSMGELLLATTEQGLCMLEFTYRKKIEEQITSLEKMLEEPLTKADHPILSETEKQLNAYLGGELFEWDIPLHLVGTPFQRRVWDALLEIPYGSTSTYLKQSQVLGDEKAIRAVAGANGKNRVSIIVPCHRIIGSDGSLIGYGGGLSTKRKLLLHEAKYCTSTKTDQVGDQLGLF